MKTVYALVLALHVINVPIEISSGLPPKERDLLANFGMKSKPARHQDVSSHFKGSVHCDPIRSASRGRPSFADSHHSPEEYRPSADLFVRDRSRSPQARYRSLRGRCMSPLARCMVPPTRIASSSALGYGLDKLECIRLHPFENPHRSFGLQRYTFPVEESIELRVAHNKYMRVPNQEHIVVSTLDNDVFAILESCEFLAGFYSSRAHRRIKINMGSSIVTPLSRKEMIEVPVGERRFILRNFNVECVGLDSSQNVVPNEPTQLNVL